MNKSLGAELVPIYNKEIHNLTKLPNISLVNRSLNMVIGNQINIPKYAIFGLLYRSKSIKI